MYVKQDRPVARTPTDLERKYGYKNTVAEMMGIANNSRDELGDVKTGLGNVRDKLKTIESGLWIPCLNLELEPEAYLLRNGWYQKVGGVVTIGWQIKAEIGEVGSVLVEISGVPYKPSVDAVGGGVAHNATVAVTVVDVGEICEGWCVNIDGIITPSRASFYNNKSTVELGGTICYLL